MNNKIALAFLILILAPLVFAFRVPKAPYPASTLTTNEKVVKICRTPKDVKPGAANLIFQSNDGGQTWEDISVGMPENEQPQDFFAGESELYMRVKNVMYSSKSDVNIPVWEKDNSLDSRFTSIVFNRSGVMAYNYDGKIYQRNASTKTWLPIYANSNRNTMRTVFEALDGTIFLGCDDGLFKSSDKGQHWKKIQNEGWVMDIVESEGVLIGTGEKGIMRSTDNGEHWEWVISEGGVGIAVEKIGGGFAAISYNTTIQSRRIHISTDNGKTWKAIDQGLPLSPSISSIKQMGNYLICGHPEGIYRSSDMGKTWNMVLPNTNRPLTIPFTITDNPKVFKLYTSGYKLYAVARNGGC